LRFALDECENAERPNAVWNHNNDIVCKPVSREEGAEDLEGSGLHNKQRGLDAVALLVEGRQMVAVLAREEDTLNATQAVDARDTAPQLLPL
jgi:hypothetical protein